MSFVDLSQSFPPLPRAPIVEAVIHWQSQAASVPEPDDLGREIANRLPEYPDLNVQHHHDFEVALDEAEATSDPRITRRTRWRGFRLRREDEPYIVQFRTDGLIFSRLAPYDDWESFQTEALKVWEVFVQLVSPTVLQRLGVRFINRIELAPGEVASKYLRFVKQVPEDIDLPLQSFLHRDVYDVPKTPYGVQLIRTIQAPGAADESEALVLDIDVFAEDLGWPEKPRLVELLADMRWLKNKFFHSFITDEARNSFLQERS